MKQLKSLDRILRQVTKLETVYSTYEKELREHNLTSAGGRRENLGVVGQMLVAVGVMQEKLQDLMVLKFSMLSSAVTSSSDKSDWQITMRRIDGLSRQMNNLHRSYRSLIRIQAEAEATRRKLTVPPFVAPALVTMDFHSSQEYWDFGLIVETEKGATPDNPAYTLFYRVNLSGVMRPALLPHTMNEEDHENSVAAAEPKGYSKGWSKSEVVTEEPKVSPFNRSPYKAYDEAAQWRGDLYLWLRPRETHAIQRNKNPDWYVAYAQVDSVKAPTIGRLIYSNEPSSYDELTRFLPVKTDERVSYRSWPRNSRLTTVG